MNLYRKLRIWLGKKLAVDPEIYEEANNEALFSRKAKKALQDIIADKFELPPLRIGDDLTSQYLNRGVLKQYEQKENSNGYGASDFARPRKVS